MELCMSFHLNGRKQWCNCYGVNSERSPLAVHARMTASRTLPVENSSSCSEAQRNALTFSFRKKKITQHYSCNCEIVNNIWTHFSAVDPVLHFNSLTQGEFDTKKKSHARPMWPKSHDLCDCRLLAQLVGMSLITCCQDSLANHSMWTKQVQHGMEQIKQCNVSLLHIV